MRGHGVEGLGVGEDRTLLTQYASTERSIEPSGNFLCAILNARPVAAPGTRPDSPLPKILSGSKITADLIYF